MNESSWSRCQAFNLFNERMTALRKLFAWHEDHENDLLGSLQDFESEIRYRQHNERQSEHEADQFNELVHEHIPILALLRCVQIMLLYTIFLSLCDSIGLVPKKKKARTGEKRPNDVIAALENASSSGLKSSIWPEDRKYIEVLIGVRNKLAHKLNMEADLREHLRGNLHGISEIPGSDVEEKLSHTGEVGSPIWLPQTFVRSLVSKLEQLGEDLAHIEYA